MTTLQYTYSLIINDVVVHRVTKDNPVMSLHFTDDVIINVSHHQFIFTIPERLQLYFRYDNSSMGTYSFHVGSSWWEMTIVLIIVWHQKAVVGGRLERKNKFSVSLITIDLGYFDMIA